ncbi:hypothetical protein [Kluyvera sp. CRP]|uniref:hypothetical protein n=1 Tax=Kluyvera sp. CRP TaxID=2873269 RepID=UPI001CC218AF|nr:hypothetical protein [Kluyvera sp. CRP]UAK20222.1 hypothetical protein K7B04_23695 [Kluyvera sp. CRP]
MKEEEENVIFLERIIPISRFYTTSYISEKTSKLIWIFFALNSIYILLHTKIITLKELSIYFFSFGVVPNQLSKLIFISAVAIFIKAIVSFLGDIKNNRYERALNAYKLRILSRDIIGKHISLMDDTKSTFSSMNEQREKLNQELNEAQDKKNNHNPSLKTSPQEKRIRDFHEKKYNHILLKVQKNNLKNDEDIKELSRLTDISGLHIKSLYLISKSYKKQWWITTLTNFIPPSITIIYTFYIHFGESIISILKP